MCTSRSGNALAVSPADIRSVLERSALTAAVPTPLRTRGWFGLTARPPEGEGTVRRVDVVEEVAERQGLVTTRQSV